MQIYFHLQLLNNNPLFGYRARSILIEKCVARVILTRASLYYQVGIRSLKKRYHSKRSLTNEAKVEVTNIYYPQE